MLRYPSILTVLCVIAAPVTAEVPKVAADILPVHSLVSQVMDGIGAPTLVIAQGADPHSQTLRPSQARALSNSDVIFWAGEALSPWLEKPIESLSQEATKVDLLALPGTILHDARTEHGDDHDHGHGHGHDPHAWLDPANAQNWLSEIAIELSRLDPQNAQIYKKNATEGVQKIQNAVALAKPKFVGLRQQAVYHDAYQYLERHFYLPTPLVLSESDASQPGAAHVAEFQAALSDQNISCIFAEPGYSAALIDRLTEDNSARAVVLDPLGNSIPPGPDHYPNLILVLADAMSSCAN